MAMVAVTAALIGFFAFVIMRVTTPQMTTLFTDLSVEDSAGIVKDLERQAIPFELRNDGAVIMVPKDKVTRLRMKLAEGGLPKGGGVGYEIFDKSDALGTTSDADNTIADGRRAGFEKRMRSQVEAIVSSVVGAGRARVQLSADFDYNKITQTSDRFDPEGRVLRSSQTREEASATAESNGQVTVNNELPGNQNKDNATPARDQSKKTEETNNYEISRTTKTEVTEAGRVNRISVAVLVDGSYAKNDKGEMVYQERSKGQLDRIAALVRSAIGFDQKRGDQVEVVNLKFAEAPAVVPVAEPAGLLGMLQFTKDDVMYVIELGVMMLLSLVVVFMVIRPLVKRILAAEEVASLRNAEPALSNESTGQNLVPGPNATAQMIDVAQVQGQVHAQSVHRVGELAERNPNETASIVRQWLSEQPA